MSRSVTCSASVTFAASRTVALLAVAAVAGLLAAGLPAAGALVRPATGTLVRPLAGRAAAAANPSSRYNVLTSVSSDSASDAWAVGSYTSNTTGVRDTLILHWNGTAWSRVPSPSPGSRFNVLNGVSAAGTKNAWAVGFYRNQSAGALPLILRWNGTAWSQVAAPAPGLPETELNGVSTVSGREAWAAGFAGQPATGQFATLILHWNGTAWSLMTSPDPSPKDSFLQGVSAAQGGGAWAVGSYLRGKTLQTLVLKWSAQAWIQVKSASPAPAGRYNLLDGVSAIGRGHAWAVGNNPDTTTGPGQTLALQWNGTSWPRVPSPDPGAGANELNAVSADSPTDAWAVGDSALALSGGPLDTLILHWDGTAWSQVSSPSPGPATNVLNGVSADSATGAWAVGYYLSKSVRDTLILHWNGTAWTVR
jgi:hypothetical protein